MFGRLRYGSLYTWSELLNSTSVGVAREDLAIWCWGQQDVMCFGMESHAHYGHSPVTRFSQLWHQLASSGAVQLKNSRSQRNITLCQLSIHTLYKAVIISLNEEKRENAHAVRWDKSLQLFFIVNVAFFFSRNNGNWLTV